MPENLQQKTNNSLPEVSKISTDLRETLYFLQDSKCLYSYSIAFIQSGHYKRKEGSINKMLNLSSVHTVNYRLNSHPALLKPVPHTINLSERIISGLDSNLKFDFRSSEMKGM